MAWVAGMERLPDAPGAAARLPAGAAVHLDNVGFRYRGDGSGRGPLALDGVSLVIPAGQIVGIVGPSGAGKTTLCQALNGIVPQFHGGTFLGAATVAGLDTVDTPVAELARLVSLILEDPDTQITAPSVELEVAFALENLRCPSAEIRVRVDAALLATGLHGLARKHPANLSGGQKQRLAIAAAVALRPRLIVLDEPTTQLDPAGAAEVFDLLVRLNRESGLTIVVASHATEELAEVAHRVVVLEAGRVVRDGPPAEVLADVEDLAARRVRPPDIAQAFDCLMKAGVLPVARVPVTLAAAAESRTGLHAVQPPPARPAPQAPRAVPALEARGLHHVYPDGTAALRGVDLAVAPGDFVALVGPNGGGKSTLVKHFLRLLSPSAGMARVGGDDVAGLRVAALARRVGYVAQNAHQHLFADTVAEEVGFALRLMRAPPEAARAAVGRALGTMRLAWAADRHPQTLSRGDRLRVAIAATLALDPGVLVFDEPTTGQDWDGARAVLGILRELNEGGRTVLLVTHHLYLLPGYARRLVVLGGGRVAIDGTLRDVLYDEAPLARAHLVAPQSVRFAQGFPELARPGRRPVSPGELAGALAAAGPAPGAVPALAGALP